MSPYARPKQFLLAFARSPLGVGALLLSIAVGVGAGLMGGHAVLASFAGIGMLGLCLAAGLSLGLVQRAAVAEIERELGAKAARRLARAATARKRLAAMRIADPTVAQARDLLVLEAGRLVEDCGRAKTYDPEAVQAVVDGPALVDAWLREADESSIEQRLGLPDANPFPEAARRTADALVAKARLVSARRAAAIGEIPGSARIAIEEELR
jgi:hypothetical protein